MFPISFCMYASLVLLGNAVFTHKIERSGCHHNGTVYANGSFVPTTEPCLSCKCAEKTLICSLRVCPEMPLPPPRGCVLVQAKNGCCPYLSCSKNHLSYHGLNRRIVAYLNQYERESIDRVVSENVLQRRSDDSDFDGPGEICVQNGTVYKSGSAMSSSSLCTYCYCIGGQQKCVKPKCMLSMEGCKPIFVDSTCCPVRYDCTSKTSGVVKSRNHIRRSDNKHYQRMVSRLQRHRGCTVNSNFYPEGHKLPGEEDKPCEICFCIRGKRQCAPKKCAPALKNCMPVIPKGQCCPSSYDCGHSYDRRRTFPSQARQFDFFSLLFGPDESENSTVLIDSELDDTEKIDVVENPSTEKGFFDTIREGLEFIDNNESAVGNILDKTSVIDNSLNLTEVVVPPSTPEPVDVGEMSLLDFLLGPGSEEPTEEVTEPNESTTMKIEINNTLRPDNIVDDDDENEESITIYDFFLGKEGLFSTQSSDTITDATTKLSTTIDNHSTTDYPSTIEIFTTTEGSENPSVTTEHEIRESEDEPEMESEESETETEESKTEIVESKTESFTQKPVTTAPEPTTINFETNTVKDKVSTTEEVAETTNKDQFITTMEDSITSSTIDKVDLLDFESNKNETFSTQAIATDSPSTENSNNLNVVTEVDIVSIESTTVPAKIEIESSTLKTTTSTKPIQSVAPLFKNKQPQQISIRNSTKPVPEKLEEEDAEQNPVLPDKESSNGFLSVLISGLSNIFKEGDNGTEIVAENSLNAQKKPVAENLVSLEKLNITELPTNTDDESLVPELQEMPLNRTSTTERSAQTTMALLPDIVNPLTPSSIDKTIVIKTNPTILDADYNFDYNEPTLPPSLPNLKIIPFLPADAVKTDRKQLFDYYKLPPTNYPSITEKHGSWILPPVPKNPNSKIDYDVYDHTLYPSITENYEISTNYPQKYPEYERPNHKKFIFNDYQYDEYGTIGNKFDRHDKYIGDIQYIQNKYDPVLNNYGPNHDGVHHQFVTPGYEKFATIFTEKSQYPSISYSTESPGYDFDLQVNRFSPPTKTEGGFVPKEPVQNHFYYDSFQTKKYVVDITTNSPKIKLNLTKIPIELTTPDPFKDVIKTEPPPDLHSLIEDKEKLLANGIPEILYETGLVGNSHGYEKDIISITTDSNYNYTSDYQDANNFQAINSIQSEKLSDLTNAPAKEKSEQLSIQSPPPLPLSESYATTTSSVFNTIPLDPSVLGEHGQGETEDDKFDFSGGLDSVLNFLLRDEEHNIGKDNSTIPPFKTLPTLPSNRTEGHEIIFLENPETSTTKKPEEDLSILHNSLLGKFEIPESEKYIIVTKIPTNPISSTEKTKPNNSNQVFADQFNKLPFFNPSFPVKPYNTESDAQKNINYNPISLDLDQILAERRKQNNENKKNHFNQEEYHQVIHNDPIFTHPESYVNNPVEIENLTQNPMKESTEVLTKPVITNSLQDPSSILKLAGCNIYGRMYGVGRIISELSGPCLECKCTEVGVSCTPLTC